MFRASRSIVVFVGAAAALGAVVVSTARAEHTAFWQQRPISTSAVMDDPALADMQSWSLMVSYDIGKWASAGVRATLPVGNVFYNNPLGGATTPNPAVVALFPAVEFDTYVTDPTRMNASLLGGHPASPTASLGGANDTIPGTFSVSWHGKLGGSMQQGTFEIARLTFPQGVLPHILQGPPYNSQSISYTVLPEQEAFVPQIPEPAGVVTGVGCVLALMATRGGRASRLKPHQLVPACRGER